MKIQVPDPRHISPTSVDDPAPYYYNWLLRYPYLKRLKMTVELLDGRYFERLLEIGYGCGIFFPELARHSRQLVGVDLHRNGRLVHNMMEREDLSGSLGVGDVLQLPFEAGSFDGVVCLSVLEFVEDLGRAMSEIHRVLKAGGIAILGAPVLNRLTGLAYERLIGHMKHQEQHKSDHRSILRLAEDKFSVLKVEQFLDILPLDYAFFFCAACQKN